MSNNYIKFIRNKNEFGDDLYIEGEDEEFGGVWDSITSGLSTTAQLLDPFAAAKSYSKKGVSGVLTEARTELADKSAPKDSLAAKIQRAAPSVVATVGLTEQTASYLRAKDSGWRGPYAPQGGTLYYWDKKAKLIKYINPETGKLVTVKKGNRAYTSLTNTTKLSWSPTSKSYFPYKSATKKKSPKSKVVRKSKAYDDQLTSSSTALTTYDGEGDMGISGGAGAGFTQHIKDNWIAYSAGAAGFLVGIPLLLMAFGSNNKDWTVVMDGVPVGSISEFYEVNKIGNKHQVEPISDIDMTMIMALQPGETHTINSANGIVIIQREIV